VITIPKRDWQTDDMQCCNHITALCVASRGSLPDSHRLRYKQQRPFKMLKLYIVTTAMYHKAIARFHCRTLANHTVRPKCSAFLSSFGTKISHVSWFLPFSYRHRAINRPIARWYAVWSHWHVCSMAGWQLCVRSRRPVACLGNPLRDNIHTRTC